MVAVKVESPLRDPMTKAPALVANELPKLRYGAAGHGPDDRAQVIGGENGARSAENKCIRREVAEPGQRGALIGDDGCLAVCKRAGARRKG